MTVGEAFILVDVFGMTAMLFLLYFITIKLDEKDKKDEDSDRS